MDVQTEAPVTRRANITSPRALSIRSTLIASIKHRLAQPCLIILTIITTTVTGTVFSFLQHNQNTSPGSLRELFTATFSDIRQGNSRTLFDGLIFSLVLLTILAAHELGHYFACKHYKVEVTTPYFLPAPPGPFTPFGTFGAVIRIKSPILSKKALFDIGLAGPLAGFFVALPAAFIGLLTATQAATPPAGSYQYSDPLLFILISKTFGIPKVIEWNPVYWAAWAGFLITSLNLFPFGQLDGGHVLFSVVGQRAHRYISRVVLGLSAILLILEFYFYGQANWLFWVALLYILSKLEHPTIPDDQPIGCARTVAAVAALIIFALSFMPFPVTVT